LVHALQGKQGSEDVQVPAELLLAAQQELKAKAQMAKDLEMVRKDVHHALNRILQP
jgi:hypothetical protein